MDSRLQPVVDAIALAVIEHPELSPQALAWVIAERVVDTHGAARILCHASAERGTYQPLGED